MSSFKEKLTQRLNDSYRNNFGIENYDEARFGKYVKKPITFTQQVKNKVKTAINYRPKVSKYIRQFDTYLADLQYLWENVNDTEKELLVDLIAYRIFGYSKVKLPINNKSYWDILARVKELKDPSDTYDPHFLHFVLEKFNLRPIGYDIEFYFSDTGVAIDFMIEQYAYKINDKYVVHVENGDVVLDVGGCWGDTALYFAHKAGKTGKVYSFEFIPDNIKIHNVNTQLNSNLKDRIELVKNPVSHISDQVIYFKDEGPSSKVSTTPFPGQTGTTKTLSIDDFVTRNNISKIDYIKMDIEGSEPSALRGAEETIRKFKPKLAIANYHSMSDFVNIPKWILDLGLGYQIFLGHYTIHAEETICFAKTIK